MPRSRRRKPSGRGARHLHPARPRRRLVWLALAALAIAAAVVAFAVWRAA